MKLKEHGIHLICPGFYENPLSAYMETLLDVDPDTFNEREKAIMDRALNFGEVYAAAISYDDEDGNYIINSDLGHGEDIVCVSMPKDVPVLDTIRAFSVFLEKFV